MSVKRVNLSLQDDTLARLDQYALEQHESRSQAVTDLVWSASVKYSQARGQIRMNLGTETRRKSVSEKATEERVRYV